MFEIKVTGLDHLADAIFALAAAMTQTQGVSAQQAPEQKTDTPATPVQPASPATPAAPATPVTQQAAAPASPAAQAPVAPVPNQGATVSDPASTVPTQPVAQTYSMEQLGVAMTGLVDSGKMEVVNQILAKFGAQTLMQVPPEYYPQLATAMREAGAVI